MKKLGIMIGVFGLFALVGTVSASTADTLQPASTITYNEELVVNDTGRFDSVYIGKQGVGGVTFFNGTIVNSTTTDDVDNPVTFGDNVRIDGRVHRGENYGPGLGDEMPFVVNDEMQVTGDLTVDGNLLGSEILTPTNLAVNTTPSDGHFLMYDDGNFAWAAAGDITGVTAGSGLTGGGTSGDVTLRVSGNINVANITTTGDITQGRTNNGAVKAMALIDGSDPCAVTRQYSSMDTTITCSRTIAGMYVVDFGFQVSDRFAVATVYDSTLAHESTVRLSPGSNNNRITALVYDTVGAGYAANDFMIVVY